MLSRMDGDDADAREPLTATVVDTYGASDGGHASAGAGVGVGVGAGAGAAAGFGVRGGTHAGATAIPAMMQAAHITSLGDLEKVFVGPIKTPTPGTGEVLIQVHYAALNPVDYKVIEGSIAASFFGKPSRRKPSGIGLDVAGVIVAFGPSPTSNFCVGDRVVAMANKMGTCAEYAVTAEETLARVPETLSFRRAAGIPLAGLTAWQMLERAGVPEVGCKPGKRVLITGGAGGVGTFAVQLAAIRGAHVIATCSSGKKRTVEQLGADTTLDYRTENYEVALKDEPVEAVADCVGEYGRTMSVLAREGTCASILYIPSSDNLRRASIAYRKPPFNCCKLCCVSCLTGCSNCRPSICCGKRKLEGVLTLPNGDELSRLVSLTEDRGDGTRRLTPVIDSTYKLADILPALKYLKDGHATGKVVIEVISRGTEALEAAHGAPSPRSRHAASHTGESK